MRRSVLALAAAALLTTAPPAHAAPTCENRAGDGVRCGTPGAMPVGWSLSPRRPAPGPTLAEVLPPLCVVAWLFALIALMPDFDGWRGDWDEQEGDRKG